MAKSKHYYIRKLHRYLGLVLGIQFLFWTLGGLYFSWNNIDEVHGDHLRQQKHYLPPNVYLASPQLAIQELKGRTPVDSIKAIQLIEILGTPTYQIHYFTKDEGATPGTQQSESHGGGHSEVSSRVQLALAGTGRLRSPLSEEEAVRIARNSVVEPSQIEKAEYLTAVGAHHEYREKPLPAWAVTFSQPACTVYISAEQGTFQAIRHNQWRAFDFLWMLHTMDFQSRDNFGNFLLKAFSILGLITVLSGFALYFVSSSFVRKARKQAGAHRI
ncbi:PepSY domain-containing protein [Rufibacter immobilis]|uniref:PepSY domain-containing protein n=1 Tax=Rufibacter immobilis TaxID=1348778 RepID=UPI0035E57CA6